LTDLIFGQNMDLWHSVLCEEVLSRDTPRHPNVEIKTHKNFFSSCTKDIILRRKTPGFKKEHFFDAKMIIINFLIDFSVICAFPYYYYKRCSFSFFYEIKHRRD